MDKMPMSEKRELLVELKTGKARPIISQAPIVSSARMDWRGFHLEHHIIPHFAADDFYHLNHVAVMLLKAPVTATVKWPGHTQEVRVMPNQVSVFPSQMPMSGRCGERHEFVLVSIEPKFLARAAHDIRGLDGLELIPKLAAGDPLVASLLMGLDQEAARGCPEGAIYAESLANMLAVHLARNYSAKKPRLRDSQGGLNRLQLARVIDFVHAHFAQDIPLSALAEVAGLSPFHFARLFKQSAGVTPHQYLIQVRVERAKGLLLNTRQSISSIAVQVGFCDQSHFATHFKRTFGVTPRVFRQRTTTGRTIGFEPGLNGE
jgi:AraC family transcriptional regulator